MAQVTAIHFVFSPFSEELLCLNKGNNKNNQKESVFPLNRLINAFTTSGSNAVPELS